MGENQEPLMAESAPDSEGVYESSTLVGAGRTGVGAADGSLLSRLVCQCQGQCQGQGQAQKVSFK